MDDRHPRHGEELPPAGPAPALVSAAAGQPGAPLPPTVGELALLHLPDPRRAGDAGAVRTTWRSWSGCWPTCWRAH